jgi:hypothetical protein
VIAGPERPELRRAALECPRRHEVRVGVVQAAALFDAIELVTVSVAVADRPFGTPFEHAPQVRRGEPQIAPMRADACRHAAEHLRDDLFQLREDIGAAQT